MTKKEFLEKEQGRSPLLRQCNATVDSFDMVEDGIRGGFVAEVSLLHGPVDHGISSCHGNGIARTKIQVPVKRLREFMDVFTGYHASGDDIWTNPPKRSLRGVVGQMARLYEYETPADEMHELADKYSFVALRNALSDSDSYLYMVD